MLKKREKCSNMPPTPTRQVRAVSGGFVKDYSSLLNIARVSSWVLLIDINKRVPSGSSSSESRLSGDGSHPLVLSDN